MDDARARGVRQLRLLRKGRLLLQTETQRERERQRDTQRQGHRSARDRSRASAGGVRQLRLLLKGLCFSFDARFSEPYPVSVHLSDFWYGTKGI